jgi:hypothetical protein
VPKWRDPCQQICDVASNNATPPSFDFATETIVDNPDGGPRRHPQHRTTSMGRARADTVIEDERSLAKWIRTMPVEMVHDDEDVTRTALLDKTRDSIRPGAEESC